MTRAFPLLPLVLLSAPLGAALALQPRARVVVPVLSFPEPGMDDTAAYRGYRTRLFRDAANNTLQAYVDGREGRVVHLLADAENASVGFTARAEDGRALAALRWAAPEARVARLGRYRVFEQTLAADAAEVRLGHFLLGSMRVERDFQYWKLHRAPLDTAGFVLEEYGRLLGALERLPAAERSRHLALLQAPSMDALRARLRPTITEGAATSLAGRPVRAIHVVQPSLDGRDTMRLSILAAPTEATVLRAGDAVRVQRARDVGAATFLVQVATTGDALTPLARREIFTPAFLAWADSQARGDRGQRARARWLERHVRGVELLVSREKMMAGLPTYATYFGRDMLVSALMMRPIWRDEMSANAIAAALRRLSPAGQVSHEEALGGQAFREASSEYAALVDAHLAAARRGDARGADTLLARAHGVLRDAGVTRENYHMIDDELQLAVLAGRWLADPNVPAATRRAFLNVREGGETRLTRLLKALALVARMTAPYAERPDATNLISFARRDDGRWASTSWRDSGVGYANGRFAMDVNAIWAPHALESIERILATLRALAMPAEGRAEAAAGTPLGRWARDPASLRAAIDAWRGAERHFVVRLSAEEVRARVAARLAAMPAVERAYWTNAPSTAGADQDPFEFLALALDSAARPIGIANTDVATALFLGEREGAARGAPSDDRRRPEADERERVLRDVRTVVRPFPVGLLIDEVGPAVANDAYATPDVWTAFDQDRYHGPRVVWGREVNLFLLGVAGRVAASSGDALYALELRAAADNVQRAAEASGFQSELWSYEFPNGRPTPVRYGSGADVQLWSTTDLVVQYVLDRMRR